MLKNINSWRANLTLVVAITALTSACTTLPGFDSGPTRPPGVTAAMELSQQGDHTAASQQYVQLADTASGSQQQRYILLAARERLLADEPKEAERLINAAGAPVANANLPLWAEVLASIRIAEDKPREALEVLNKVTAAADRQEAIRILKLRAETLFKLNRLQAAVATFVKLEALLQNRADIYANHDLIWNNLERSATPIVSQSIESATNSVVAGWLELGQIGQQKRGSPARFRTQLMQWQESHPQHPANANLLPKLLDQLVALSNFPANVAVLLPLSGKQKVIGETIRDGYLTAMYSLSEVNARPVIRFYDTAQSSAIAAYDLAVNNGAEFIVGPLLKPEVNAIVDRIDTVPTLALNFAVKDKKAPALLYQFALAPEDEARSVARRAVAEGWFNAVALVPQNSWGTRVYDAFQQELIEQGGQVLAAKAYQDDTPDFSDTIRNVLLLDESQARRDRLAANLGEQLEYEPRRRTDVDFIFIAANAPTAKLLRPQLRFHYAGNLPTFATSSIYIPGSEDNSELNGIIFPDVPWLINPTAAVAAQKVALKKFWGANADQRARFFALGYDAYQLSAALNGRSGRFKFQLSGMTGDIEMDRNGQLHRDLDFARIKGGKPQLVAEPEPESTPISILTLPTE